MNNIFFNIYLYENEFIYKNISWGLEEKDEIENNRKNSSNDSSLAGNQM